MVEERIVFFGTGRKYACAKQRHPKLFEKINIVAFLDNDSRMWERTKDGIVVMSPSMIDTLVYDRVILMAAVVKDMREQLLTLGVPSEKIMIWPQFLCLDKHGIFKEYKAAPLFKNEKKKILLISVRLDYNGGTIAAANAAKALNMRGYHVTLAAPDGNAELIREMCGQGLRVVIAPAIEYPETEELEWISQFDIVFVNVFQMIRCACVVSKIKPVIWWIHENSDRFENVYSVIRDHHCQYDDIKAMESVRIAAVSRRAKENFNFYYPLRIREILPYGIPDTYQRREKKPGGGLVMAVVGLLHPRKAQSIFLDAVRMLRAEEKKDIKFWLIGKCLSDAYAQEVIAKAEGLPEVTIFGELTQEEMQEKYAEIDVVICPSLEETMSLTVTEGMMLGKICMTTDATGMADYIQDKKNGLICRAGSAKSLCETIRWVLGNPDRHREIGDNARKTYLKYFTMEQFGIRLQRVIEEVGGMTPGSLPVMDGL